MLITLTFTCRLVLTATYQTDTVVASMERCISDIRTWMLTDKQN